MDGTAKKISFGFSKLQKPSALSKPKFQKSEDKVEYIDCLESKTIKVKSDTGKSSDVDDVENDKNEVKVIPLRRNTIRLFPKQEKSEKVPVDDSLESIAAREILEESKGKQKEAAPSTLVIDQKEQETADLQKEPTLEDYESVPVSSFGMAMLRGMGWDPNKGVGKNEKQVKLFEPTLRPKGLGLGAGKQTGSNGDGEDNKVELGCHVKILSKTNADVTGEVVSFDEDSGRLVVKTSDGTFVSVHEMMVKVIKKKSSNDASSGKRSYENNSATTKKHKYR
ncbi:G-patch domain and KOW motifs-containing protein [Schistocerca piceifrons]|uniref:G-patch domain and KOW motifs-containing protein n=1 Tax=Schistocerca piceifrons TaxID=274613 RepID=UPI001F5E74B7|nr:G-patch domain and KOW motifs-containing protein [Schistocerca piceifrons]